MLTRRVLLLVGALSLNGCSLDAARPSPDPSATPDPDEALVASVVAAITTVRQLAEGTPFATLNDAHLSALEAPPAASPTPGAGQAPDAVRASETALRQTLFDACLRARSPRLASLLASMSAGVAQALV